MSDDESKPMTRTELAMLWDLLGRWLASHPGRPYPADLEVTGLREDVDAELTERFGG